MCRSSMWAPTRLVTRWSASSTLPPGSPGPVTPFCWRRGAPPWTCSPTTAPAATRSPRPCTHGSPAPTDHQPDQQPDSRGARETMTTANPEDAEPARIRPPLGSGVVSGWRSLRDALDKPLASYYLLLGASGLLLTIGLIMVLSASSVRSYLVYDDSYAVVKRQLMWVAIGLPCAWVASRLPIRHVRRLAYPGFLFALVLLALV